MSIQSDKANILSALKRCEEILHEVDEETYLLTPAEYVWSVSEIYAHILTATLMSIIAAEKCINGTGEHVTKRLHWLVWSILFFGRFPPGKFKVPSKLLSMVTKMSKEDAENLIIKLRKKTEEICPKISKANIYIKNKHPRIGMLNAEQWFRFTLVHLNHHLKQIDRTLKTVKAIS